MVYGTSAVTLGGKLSVGGTFFPAMGNDHRHDQWERPDDYDQQRDGGFLLQLQSIDNPVNASPYTITYSYAGSGPLNPASDTSRTLTVTPKALTITGLTGGNKVTMATPPRPSPARRPGGSNQRRHGYPRRHTIATFADKNVGTANPITVSGYTVSGTGAGNYTLTQPTGLTGDITAKALTVSGLTGNDKVYDGNTTASFSGTAALSGKVTGDDIVTLGGTPSASFADKNVGTSKPITVAGYSVSGADDGNYAFMQPAGLTGNITSKPLTVTATSGQTKVKGTSDPTFTFSSSGLVSGDSITGALSRGGGEGPGTYTLTQGTVTNANNRTTRSPS